MARESRSMHSLLKIVVFLAFALLLPCAQANVLGNGNSVTPSPLFPTGTVFGTASGTITATVGSDHLSVSYTQTVYQDPLNTWCANCLDFVYVFHNNGPDVNERYSMSSFAGFLLDVGTNPFAVHDPTTIDRSGTGPNVGFNFPGNDEIMPGQTTVMLVIETNATKVVPGTVSAQDGIAGAAFAWAPATIPEPGSLVLMGSGLIAVGSLLRRSRLGNRS